MDDLMGKIDKLMTGSPEGPSSSGNQSVSLGKLEGNFIFYRRREGGTRLKSCIFKREERNDVKCLPRFTLKYCFRKGRV